MNKVTLRKFKAILCTTNVLAAIIGALITGGIAISISVLSKGPSADELQIRNLISMEASLVRNNLSDAAILLYTNDASIIDVAGGVSWVGMGNIMQRYATLPHFVSLEHTSVDVEVHGNTASATADTVGAYISDGQSVPISSNHGEKWAFEKIDDNWRITSFRYNMP